MLAKIKLGIYNTTCEYIEPNELEEFRIKFDEFILTITKDRGEIIVTSAITPNGKEIIEDLAHYELIIETL